MTGMNLLTLLVMGLIGSQAEAKKTAYLFTYFVGNGEDGLHLAWSPDGYKWQAVAGGKSLLQPKVGKARLMRDPCVTRGPDGTYHMVWTTGWWEDNIGYASTRDILTWSDQKAIPVMAHEPNVRNCWAPEIVWDQDQQEFVIFWSSTITGRFPQTAGSSESDLNHRIYYTTTKDFQTFSPTRLFYDPGFSVIDATLLQAEGRYYLIVKDETRYPPKKHLRIASSDSIRGPFVDLSPPITPPGRWSEGPSAIRIGQYYVVYYDAYRDRFYAAARSKDLRTWEDATAQMQFVKGMHHGTVIEVPMALVEHLEQ
ncbi:MAG: glycoside hydrolase family 43 protein [Sedimentisphaerales bacterium]|jgi:hypothetical protein|nr:glycoside hydrolase family 43 protein [Sedimentisphaerales bacterium]